MSRTIQQLIDEGNVSHGRRTHVTAEALLEDFAKELGLRNNEVPKEAVEPSTKFILEVILPISWYSTRIKHAQRIRLLYILGTAALILTIPPFLAWFPVLTNVPATHVTTTIAAQVVLSLTCLVA